MDRPAGNNRGQVSRGQLLNGKGAVQCQSIQVCNLAAQPHPGLRGNDINMRNVNGKILQVSVYCRRSDKAQPWSRSRSNAGRKSVAHNVQLIALQYGPGLKGQITQTIRSMAGKNGLDRPVVDSDSAENNTQTDSRRGVCASVCVRHEGLNQIPMACLVLGQSNDRLIDVKLRQAYLPVEQRAQRIPDGQPGNAHDLLFFVPNDQIGQVQSLPHRPAQTAQTDLSG